MFFDSYSILEGVSTGVATAQEDPNIYYYKIRVSFLKEILSFRSTLRNEIEKSSSIRELADLLIIKNHFMSSSFPEVSTVFLLFLIIPVTTTSSERSFSKLKLIKTYLRNYIGQERLRNLAIYPSNIL